MRELVKYLLGIVIILTIIYTIFISYNVFVFINSDDSNLKIESYSKDIELVAGERALLEEMFNDANLQESSNDININYDGTPISWVLKIERVLIDTSPEKFKSELLENSFISIMTDEYIFIGPYIDKSQLELAKQYLQERFNQELGTIERWKI
ncbi:MAG: hypothetical protein ACJ0GK_03205 [Gammaproteobacteria bacterium]|jgi:hypothetical protein|tara:strand:- start:18205 stop:18663 length:459 start_codon:yes stop_codon:yes gene_type:complete